MIGGSLSRPADRFPRLFGQNEFLRKYPYFLPCSISATFSAVACVVAFLFLKETVSSPIPIQEFLQFRQEKAGSTVQRSESLGEATPISPLMPNANVAQPIDELIKAEKPLPFRALLTRRVIIAAGNYASLSFVDISFRAIQPLFLFTPIHLGGLGLQPSAIGNILSIFGVLNGVVQIFFFARINERWGPKRVFSLGIASAIPMFASFPVINLLARHYGYSMTVWMAVGFQIVMSATLCFSYGQCLYFGLFRVALPLTLTLPPQVLSSFTLPTHHPIGPLSEQPTV